MIMNVEKRIAILATNGFEESELMSPKAALEGQGWTVDVVSLAAGSIKGWKDGDWGASVVVDKTVDRVSAKDYNALVLPGGVMNPDTLRTNDDALIFVRDFFKQHKIVGAICHAPSLLISADVVSNRTLTSYKSIKDDLVNAGAKWQDKEVIVDEGFVTSRTPADLDAFNAKLIEEIKEGKHEEQHA